jgi:hypothetical protein
MEPFDRFDRAFKALMLALLGPALARLAAMIGSAAPIIAIPLMVLAFACLVYALGLLISCAFAGRPQPGGYVPSDPWGHTPPEPPDSTPIDTTECHCMNCLNKRSW